MATQPGSPAAAEGLIRALGHAFIRPEHGTYERTVAATSSEAAATGRALSRDETIAGALAVPLTSAEGKSNREIAAALSIGLLTAQTYVARILAKLDLPSGSSAAAYALRHGLA